MTCQAIRCETTDTSQTNLRFIRKWDACFRKRHKRRAVFRGKKVDVSPIYNASIYLNTDEHNPYKMFK